MITPRKRAFRVAPLLLVGALLFLAGGYLLAQPGCQPQKCEFIGVTAKDVGSALAAVGGTEVEHGLFGGSQKTVWSDDFKQDLSEGRGGTAQWRLDHFLSSTEGIDKIAFGPNQEGRCVLELKCSRIDNGTYLPGVLTKRNAAREKRLLLETYQRLKSKKPSITAHLKGDWQLSDPLIVESHQGALWIAVEGLPLAKAVEYFRERGFTRRT